MGVPKFYRWISERYPCLSEIVKEYQLPEFDNLYLDMNGIIHTCSHPDDNNPHFRITEEKIFADVFHYIEVLFRMIKPRKVFFMAIDGVAPRAKMNQQRGRRFRSAREAEELIKRAISKGESLPKEERFDSNCITPGTEFMARLHEALKYFVAKKVSTDRLWQGPRIYLSGHETPGEGEHKIMDFIRSEKARTDYDPNTRHCLYGLDADLIMLGLTTHEPHFALLREEVKFTGRVSQKRSVAPEETTFHLLHLSLLREYLDYEFAQLKTTLPFEYSVERVIDDWVLMGFLVGNDFIPHLPHIHIHQECLPVLWSTYKQVLPKLDGYLNEGGFLHLARFEEYMKLLSQFDIDNFQERYADLKWAEGKMKKLEEALLEVDGSEPISYKTSSLSSDRVGIPTASEFLEQKGMNDPSATDSSEQLLSLSDDAESDEGVGEEKTESSSEEAGTDEDATFASEFKKYKANYYVDKMDFTDVTPAVLQSQSHGYVKAIQWILHYYYNGCQSWSWFYPHHYAPYLSDVKDFKHMKMDFDMGKPFLPFQQLMAVLPTASKNLLPAVLQSLMVQETSPVIDYYPVNFETDLNGKQQEWEAVVLIPFIDEERLLAAMNPLEENLAPDEKRRNRHGPHHLYEYSPQSVGIYKSPHPTMFADIPISHAAITELATDAFVLAISELKKGLCEGVQDLFYPGFPTLKHIEHTAALNKAGVKVFQMNSRGDNMILHITGKPAVPLQVAAEQLVGHSVFVGWPHLFEAFVTAVSDDETRISMVDSGNQTDSNTGDRKVLLKQEPMSVDDATFWHRDMDFLTERYLNRWGTEVGTTQLLIHAKPIAGRRYVCSFQGKVTLERQWQPRPEPFLFQTVVKDLAVYNQNFSQFKTLEELFPAKTKVFLLGNPHYGCAGEVLDVEKKDDARIRVNFTVPAEPDLSKFQSNGGGNLVRYFPGYSLAQRIGITPHLLSRITGTVYLTQNGLNDTKSNNRINIGLNLKYNKTNKEVPGYTRKVENDWLYSNKVADVLSDYISRFPEVFDCVRTSNQNNVYHIDEMFKTDKDARLEELTKYLKTLACASITPVSQGTLQVEEETVKEIENLVGKAQEQNKRKKKLIKMQVRPHLLYQPLDAQATLVPDPSATYELFDRVVNVRDGYSVPFGLRGTIIGIIPGARERESVYEVVFDEEFLDGLTIRSSPNRCYQMPSYALVNITYGERKDTHRGHQMGNTGAGQGLWRTNTEQASGSPRSKDFNHDRRSNASARERNGASQQQPRANFPAPQILPRPQENKEGNFEEVWNQLKGLHKQNTGAKPKVRHAENGATGGATAALASSNVQPLLPPKAWIESSLEKKKQMDEPKAGLTASKVKAPAATEMQFSNGLKAVDSGIVSEGALLQPNSEGAAATQIVMPCSEVVAKDNLIVQPPCPSGSNESGSNNSADRPAISYGQPVKLDDLFKGLRECCSLHDRPQLPASPDARPKPHAEQKRHHDAVIPPAAASLLPGMSPAIRPTTLAPETEQPSAEFPVAGHTSVRLQHPPPRQAVGYMDQNLLAGPAVQPQMTSPSYPGKVNPQLPMPMPSVVPVGSVQPLMSLPLAQPARSLMGPIPHQPMTQQQQLRTALPPQLTLGNSVRMLSMYCQSKEMPEPQYQCQNGGDGRFRFVVYLHGGVKFLGSWAKQVDQAAESAAGVAMFHLNMSMKKFGFPAGTESMGSANSAFTRVQTFQGPTRNYPSQPTPGFFPPQQPGFGSAGWAPGFINPSSGFVPSQFPARTHRQKDAAVPPGGASSSGNHFNNAAGSDDRFLNPTPKEQRSVKSKNEWTEPPSSTNSNTETGHRAAAPAMNQFIPTQVLRQNKTPVKPSKVPSKDDDMVSPVSTADESSKTEPVLKSTSEDLSKLNKQETSPPTGSAQQPVDATSDAVLPQRNTKRTRSRIAANFNLSKE